MKTDYKKLEGLDNGKYVRLVIPSRIKRRLRLKSGNYVKVILLNKQIIIEKA